MKKIAALLLSSFLLVSCAGHMPEIAKKPTNAEEATAATLTAVPFGALPGWGDDQQQEAIVALQKSCALFSKRAPETPVNPTEIAGVIRDWQTPCQAVLNFTGDAPAARIMLENHFAAYRIDTEYGSQGLFTGYYETMLSGSRVKTARYNVPLYKRPADLVMVDLGEFRPALKGERIAGKVVSGNLKPYANRADIDNGALKDNPVIAWVDDADAAFFLHIQGSGRVLLENGNVLRVGYDGQNGHIYTAIGKELISRGELTPETTNLESIRAWLKAHPAEAPALRQKNESYVFFKILEGEGPLGAQGVAITATRSMAVDPRFVAYGTPVWLDIPHPTTPSMQIRRLMVAQDTGGAIRGPVRGDFFWGAGVDAERNAGMMKSRGRMWVLLPKTLSSPRHVALVQAPAK